MSAPAVRVTDTFVTLGQAAEMLGTERHAIARLVRKGMLEVQWVGRTGLIEKRAVSDLVVQRSGRPKRRLQVKLVDGLN